MLRESTTTEKKVFAYLNDLRESGKTNMFGARPYVIKKFKMESNEAQRILMLWMKNFNNDGNYEKIEDASMEAAS